MKRVGVGAAGRELRALLEGGATAALSDGQLLDRFSAARGEPAAEAAFAALVARHGPMVWGTCRRILRDSHAAEDAFQATFLVLVQKAGSVRVDDSLGRWLHGVGVRVALRARADRSRRLANDLADLDPSTPPPDRSLEDLRAAIDEEVDRLPTAYRSVVVLCYLEGLTRERAATRLGCPVGTVNSRLSRAGELLKARLTRRGLAPNSAAGMAAFGASTAVPVRLVVSTLTASTRLAIGGTLAGIIPRGVATLLQGTLRNMSMMTLMKATALGSGLLALAALAVGAKGQDPSKGESGRTQGPPKVAAKLEPAPPTASERFRAIKAEWDAANQACWAEVGKAKTKAERNDLYGKFSPNDLDYFRRCLDLADANPKDPGAREAWLWVVTEGMRNNDAIGARALPIGKAVEGLLRHHSEDERVYRTAMNITNTPSSNRDTLMRGLHQRATTHQAKGCTTLALAQYLGLETTYVKWAHDSPTQPAMKYQDYDDEGRPVLFESGKYFDDACWERFRLEDEAALRRQSEDLYQLLIAEYADVPYDPWMYEGQKIVKNPHPKSLADAAQAKLDDLHNLAVGKPAPEIEGVDLDGKPLKLSDYKGKVVAVIFWNSGCGPCLAAVPHERELVEKLKDKPFAILGVNTDEKPEAGLKAAREAKMDWPSWRDGLGGPIYERYHVRSFPTTFVIDEQGIIRHKNAYGAALDLVVGEILAKMAAPDAAGTK